MKHAGITALIILGLVGCGGTTTATSSPSESASAPAPVSSPVANDDPCGVLSADEINAVLGTTFEAGESTGDSARDIANCTYTMMVDVAGTQVPGSIVDVGLTNVPGEEAFDTNKDLALSYFGNDPEDVTVEGATKAYVVNNAETDSPVIGILVGDRYALIQIGVEGATVEQAQQLAQTAATRLG
jgi:Protein of unknown function (DUF3558)